jgi:hypothetical protein
MHDSPAAPPTLLKGVTSYKIQVTTSCYRHTNIRAPNKTEIIENSQTTYPVTDPKFFRELLFEYSAPTLQQITALAPGEEN